MVRALAVKGFDDEADAVAGSDASVAFAPWILGPRRDGDKALDPAATVASARKRALVLYALSLVVLVV